MQIIKERIKKSELTAMAQKYFGDLVKAVVDIEKEMMVIGGDLHADGEALLLSKGSDQKNLWGVNLYPDKKGKGWIEFNSVINIRPSQDNRSRGVENLMLQKKIRQIVNNLVSD